MRAFPRLLAAFALAAVTSAVQALMHPRARASGGPVPGTKRARAVLEFVRERGAVHPRGR